MTTDPARPGGARDGSRRSIDLIAVDLDGTLLDSSGHVHGESAAGLRDAMRSGIAVVVATTRHATTANPFAREIGASGPIILCGGAEVRGGPDGPIWHQAFLPRPVAAELLAWLDETAIEVSVGGTNHHYWRRREGQPKRPPFPGIMMVDRYCDIEPFELIRILSRDPRMPELIDEVGRS